MIALDLMLGHEGGYVNNPKDQGGVKKYGITQNISRAPRGTKCSPCRNESPDQRISYGDLSAHLLGTIGR